MRFLENELGAELFRRGARHITLTEAGEVLYRYAVEILELEHVAKEEIGSMRAGQKGNLRLGLVSSCASNELYDELRLFHKDFPEVHVKLFEGNTYEQMEMLRKGKVDVAVLRTPFPSYGLESVTIRHDRMAVAAAKGKLPVTNGTLTLKALEKRPIIIYRRWEKLVLDEFEKEMAVPEVYCVTDDARTSLQWAEAGIGIAIVPESILAWGKNLETAFLAERILRLLFPSSSAAVSWRAAWRNRSSVFSRKRRSASRQKDDRGKGFQINRKFSILYIDTVSVGGILKLLTQCQQTIFASQKRAA